MSSSNTTYKSSSNTILKGQQQSSTASPFLLKVCAFFIGFYTPRILGKYYGLTLVNSFSVSNFPEFLDFVSLYFAEDFFLILFEIL